MTPHTSWVVYRSQPQKGDPVNAVCTQGEWEAMERAQPGRHVLVRGGIASETEAEKLARGTSGDPVPRHLRPPLTPPASPPAS